MGALATRRALFAGAAILAAVPLAAVPQPTLAQTWVKAQAARDHIEVTTYPDDLDGTLFNADCDAFRAMEKGILSGPIASRADAAAKVRCAVASLQEGEYADGSDYRALEQVARWLEAGGSTPLKGLNT